MRGTVAPEVQRIFQEQYRRLRPRASLPEIRITFYHFASLTNTIRLREGSILVRLSDLLEGAPATVLQAIAHILLAKLYRLEIEKGHLARYRRHISSRAVTEKAHQIRKLRGRKHLGAPQGHVYDLEEIFEDLNRRYFHGLMARPALSWSRNRSRQSLGHYDPAHNAILVSRIFDDPRVPRFAVEYLVFHEMLHLRHPVKLRGSRRCVHSHEFLAEERRFPHFEQAKAFLKRL